MLFWGPTLMRAKYLGNVWNQGGENVFDAIFYLGTPKINTRFFFFWGGGELFKISIGSVIPGKLNKLLIFLFFFFWQRKTSRVSISLFLSSLPNNFNFRIIALCLHYISQFILGFGHDEDSTIPAIIAYYFNAFNYQFVRTEQAFPNLINAT